MAIPHSNTALRIADSLDVPLSSLTGEMIPTKSLDSILALLHCLEWFRELSSKDQEDVTQLSWRCCGNDSGGSVR